MAFSMFRKIERSTVKREPKPGRPVPEVQFRAERRLIAVTVPAVESTPAEPPKCCRKRDPGRVVRAAGTYSHRVRERDLPQHVDGDAVWGRDPPVSGDPVEEWCNLVEPLTDFRISSPVRVGRSPADRFCSSQKSAG